MGKPNSSVASSDGAADEAANGAADVAAQPRDDCSVVEGAAADDAATNVDDDAIDTFFSLDH